MTNIRVDIAQRLATGHFEVEPNLRQVFLLQPEDGDREDDPIMLLEVVEGSFAEDIFAVGFPPDPGHGIPYRSAIVEIQPQKLRQVSDTGVTLRGRRWRVGQQLGQPEPAL